MALAISYFCFEKYDAIAILLQICRRAEAMTTTSYDAYNPALALLNLALAL
jgi:hypothetical protein